MRNCSFYSVHWLDMEAFRHVHALISVCFPRHSHRPLRFSSAVSACMTESNTYCAKLHALTTLRLRATPQYAISKSSVRRSAALPLPAHPHPNGFKHCLRPHHPQVVHATLAFPPKAAGVFLSDAKRSSAIQR